MNDKIYYIGIDGGGSNCRAIITDQHNNTLGQGCSGPANLQLGVEQALNSVTECASIALKETNATTGLDLNLSDLIAGIGLAGVVTPEDIKNALPIKELFKKSSINNDAYIACLGAHEGQDGGIIIVGTGSCATAIVNKKTTSFGGWGFGISDHASGAYLGREAITQSLLALEKFIPGSLLTQQINAHFENDPNTFLRWSQTAKARDYAAFTPWIFNAAKENDIIATSIIQAGCKDLYRMLERLVRHDCLRISLLGGLTESYSEHIDFASLPVLQKPKRNALQGAILLARKHTEDDST